MSAIFRVTSDHHDRTVAYIELGRSPNGCRAMEALSAVAESERFARYDELQPDEYQEFVFADEPHFAEAIYLNGVLTARLVGHRVLA